MTGNTNQPTLVVGVGASAGGLEAFKRLMKAIPGDSGMAFLLVQHLDPNHKSLLAELLQPLTQMAVVDADQGAELSPNTVYIIRPDTALGVKSGKLEITPPTLRRGIRLPVDHLFRSLAKSYGPRSVAMVLSGAGSDGSDGIREIKSANGLVIAQEPDSTGQAGMPQSAIQTGLVDLVMDIDDMPEALARFAALPPGALVDSTEAENEKAATDSDDRAGWAKHEAHVSHEVLSRLAAILDAHTNFDLRVYKPATIQRRVIRRMVLSGFETIEPYLELLRGNTSEQHILVRDLLINVTEFFRDPEVFKVLRETVIDPAVLQATQGDTLRTWVAGCATGEEAYSIAIEFLDAINAHGKNLTLQIFATDVDSDALAYARLGIYPPSISERISERRLTCYFSQLEGRGYQVRPLLRDVVSFAAHDLTKDPPFSRMDLVSCRNVLIYLTAEAQKHVLRVLHFALRPDGHLILSTSESTGPQRELFSTMSKSERIYKKLGASKAINVPHSRNRSKNSLDAGAPLVETSSQSRSQPGANDLTRRAVLDAMVPPTLVVSEEGTIIFSHGELGPYLRIPEGDHPRFELSAVLRPEIATRVRGALYKCRNTREAVSAISSPDGGTVRSRITARPAPSLGPEVVIVSFENVAQEQEAEPAQRLESSENEAIVDQLDRELKATREDLRNTVEELETANEELRSSNEESMSMNEELQSANEELEATTEELRSLNEELTTVNTQLRDKVEQLELAHDDLNNFMSSTKIATIFLDHRLCIKRFTPAAHELLGLDYSDSGRFVGDTVRELLRNDLEREVTEVLEHLTPKSRELRTSEGGWIVRHVLPYRTENRRIEGVVVTFVDITALKTATQRLEQRERQQGVIAKIGLLALKETDLQSFMNQVVREIQRTLGTDYCKILELQPGKQKMLLRAGVGWQSNLVGSAFVGTGPESQAGFTLLSSEPVIVEDLPTEKRFAGPELLIEHGVISGVSCIIGDSAHPYGVLGAHTRQSHDFSAEDANFIQAAATVVGSAVHRHQSRVRLALELAAAHALAEATDLDRAFEQVLQKMASELGPTIVSELWWPDGDTLVRTKLYASSQRERFAKETSSSVPVGTGLVGSVFEQQIAMWSTDLGDPETFNRASSQSLPLLSGLALPILAQGKVLGVIALYSPERLITDDMDLRSLESVGRAIGDFINRWEAEESARQLATITASSHDAILSYRLDGSISKWLPGATKLFGYSAEEMVGSFCLQDYSRTPPG